MNNPIWTAPEQGTFKCNVDAAIFRIETVMEQVCAFETIEEISLEHRPCGGKVALYLMKPKLGA
ncbi:hypothetical protein TSUD_272920 [Trifolium subterraneum]|uniref:Uncharacterized protein n=1 Tax=Trifolium subterraneum TaxID=3900 RepID=A0A2Z6P0K0_TRISU|nr:hypothetical protein TSUD_272920 [Trifolium subterraneum]